MTKKLQVQKGIKRDTEAGDPEKEIYNVQPCRDGLRKAKPIWT